MGGSLSADEVREVTAARGDRLSEGKLPAYRHLDEPPPPRGAAYDVAVSASESETPAELRRLRDSIDNIDAALVHLLAERFKCTQQVGELKARRSMPPADPAREELQIARLRALAHDAGLDPLFAEKFLTFIIGEVIRHHEAIADQPPASGSPPPVG